MGRVDVSVVLALYNGQKWIYEQMNSILKQLEENDELIVVDDCSTDLGLKVVRSFNSPRVRIIQNAANQGHVKTFVHGIENSRNEYILLSDQDDIWLDNRLAVMRDFLGKNSVDLLVTQYSVLNSEQLFDLENVKRVSSTEVLLDIFLGRHEYYGCTYALRRSVFQGIPVPDWIPAHDLAIAIYAAMISENIFYSMTPTVFRRLHSSNLTISNATILNKFKNRIWMLKYLLKLSLR